MKKAAPTPKQAFRIWYVPAAVAGLALAYYVVNAFSGRWPIYAGIPIGGFTLRFYGLCIMGGAIAGALLARARLARYGFSEKDFDDLFFVGLFFGLGGARLGWAVQNIPYLLKNPLALIGIENGSFHGFQGLSIHGAELALLGYIFIFQKWKKIPWYRTGDLGVPGLALGQAIGRWGNFFNQELYGYPTHLPWKMYIAKDRRLPGYESNDFFHPVFLYEAVLDLATCFLLLKLERAGKLRPSVLMWTYGFLYGLARFLVETVRIEPRPYFGGRLDLGQLVSIAFMVVWGSFALYVQFRPVKPAAPRARKG